MAVALTKPAVGDFIDSITANTLGLHWSSLMSFLLLFFGQKLRRHEIRLATLDIVIVSHSPRRRGDPFQPSVEQVNRSRLHANRDSEGG